MIIRGKLNLKHDNDNYIMFSGGRLVDLTEHLNLMLLQDVHMSVKSMYDGKVFFDLKGKLVKDRVQPMYYMYHIDGQDIDSILWGLVGLKLEIEVNNITKE